MSSSITSLPPLAQAIPEFHTAQPAMRHEPTSAYSPGSISVRPHSSHHPMSPAFDTGKLNPYPQRRESTQDLMRPSRGPIDPRRLSVMSSEPSYLPPVSSIASSRGSSFDLETSDRSYTTHSFRSMSDTPRYPEHPPALPWQSDNRLQQYGEDHYRGYHSEHSSMTYGPPSPQQYRAPYGAVTGHGHNLEGMDVDRSRSTKRKRGNLPKHVTDVLRQWFEEHENHPYPTEEEKQMLIHRTGLLMSQISNWFINARRRRVPNSCSRRE